MLPVDRRITFHGLHGNYVQRLCLPCGVFCIGRLLFQLLRYASFRRLQTLHDGIPYTGMYSFLLLLRINNRFLVLLLRSVLDASAFFFFFIPIVLGNIKPSVIILVLSVVFVRSVQYLFLLLGVEEPSEHLKYSVAL